MTAPSAYTVARPSDDRQSEPANAWQEEALCREVDPELFFPEGTGADWRTPRRICAACPVKDKCLEAAMREETGQSLASRAGMRGGMTPKERWTADQPSRDTRPAPSPRRALVVAMTRAGKSAREIATELNIQPATVAEQRRRARVAGELQ